MTELHHMDAAEGAHLAHLIMDTLTTGLPGLSTLDAIVRQLETTEKTVTG